jgi:hypothetical protein
MASELGDLRLGNLPGDAADWRSGLGCDAVVRVNTLQLGLLEVGMDLDLVSRRHDRGLGKQAPG